MGLNRFGWVQLILVRVKLDIFLTNFYNVEVSKMICTRPKRNWTCPKRLVLNQNDMDGPK
jgi:hypothetical protein